MDQTFKMFVYGTLMRGFRNYDKYLSGKVFHSEAAWVSGEIFHLFRDRCPALRPGSGRVHGELIEFSDDSGFATLKAVDELERHFVGYSETMYERVPAVVHTSGGIEIPLSAYYFANDSYFHSSEKEYIPDGDWRRFAIERGIY